MRNNRQPGRSSSSHHVEAVERRRLLSAAVLANGVLTVTGTAGADTIAVDLQGAQYGDTVTATVTANGATQTFVVDTAALAAVVVNAGVGNDSVAVALGGHVRLPTPTVNGGDGDDTLHAYDYDNK